MFRELSRSYLSEARLLFGTKDADGRLAFAHLLATHARPFHLPELRSGHLQQLHNDYVTRFGAKMHFRFFVGAKSGHAALNRIYFSFSRNRLRLETVSDTRDRFGAKTSHRSSKCTRFGAKTRTLVSDLFTRVTNDTHVYITRQGEI